MWLAPVQVKVLPVSDKSMEYARGVTDKLFAAGIRVEIDERAETIGYKIREARQIDRVPYMMIIGEREADEGTIRVLDRATDKTVARDIDVFIAQVTQEIATRA